MNSSTLAQKLWNYCNGPGARKEPHPFAGNRAGRCLRAIPAHPARRPGAEHPDGRWRSYTYDECIARDRPSLDIFWLRDESLADSDNPPLPEVIAQEIVDDLEAALEQFRLIAADLGGANAEV